MKFARYLQETQTPEWKKAYIDYRKLKKRIAAIRRLQEGHAADSSSEPTTPSPETSKFSAPETEIPTHAPASEPSSSEPTRYRPYVPEPPSGQRRPGSSPFEDDQESVSNEGGRKSDATTSNKNPPHPQARRPSIIERMAMAPRQIRAKSFTKSKSSRPNTPQTASVVPLHDLLKHLSPQELAFFTTLDAELDKIESFYLDREKEMQARTLQLKQQLNELLDHRKLFDEKHSGAPWPSHLGSTLTQLVTRQRSNITAPNSVRNSRDFGEGFDPLKLPLDIDDKKQKQKAESNPSSPVIDGIKLGIAPKSRKSQLLTSERGEKKFHPGGGVSRDSQVFVGKRPLDSEDYLYAKKKLKKAILEHYRGLEALHNYRILNITGFRKALKKFEKVTSIPAQQQYMNEKIDKSAFASDKTVKTMMQDVEELYATVFAKGNKKTAMARLRAGQKYKSHHFSAFRSGIFLGTALPGLTFGMYHSFQLETREAIPAWDGLLLVYSTFFVPVLFSILVGTNLAVWARARINYVFIIELDVRTKLDYHEYFETPALLLAALCYCFWLSFSRATAPLIDPTTWPLIWLAGVGIIMFNPLPLLHRSSRFWLLRTSAKLLASGFHPVEFADFWLGDQFCSLAYTLSHLYTLVCAYSTGFDDWHDCRSSSPNWPITFVLAALPSLIRLVQSIKRYYDSKRLTHLINGGKYASGIVSSLFYYLWRHQGSERGVIFALWCLFNTSYSIYASSWDFLMDWSVLRLRARHLLLRQELVYSSHVPFYYFAIVSNVIIRFIWLLYIPEDGPNVLLRSFIIALLEVFRRWQWNFYRLENEHLGNVDQYRITREVPLPYTFDSTHDDDADDDECARQRARNEK